uniref:Secreted protein n=1 Tax=Oryza nivara TaxID=4536 RepID=A0A0E0I4Z2_ORYNI
MAKVMRLIFFGASTALSGITSPMSFGDLLGSIVFRLCKGYGASGCRDIAPRVIICQTPMNTGSVSCKAMLSACRLKKRPNEIQENLTITPTYLAASRKTMVVANQKSSSGRSGGVAAEQDDGRPGEGQRPKNFLVNLSVIATK